MLTMRGLIYSLFAVLLASSLVLSHASRVSAADYAALPAKAADVKPKKAGEAAPAFTVRTVDGDSYHFDPDHLQKPAVLISFRGGWCPYCNLHLSELRHVIPEINELGFDVLFLSGDRPDQLYSSLQAETQDDIEGAGYVILSDADTEAARALGTAFRVDSGLTDYLEKKGRDYSGSSIGQHNALAVPAVYVIDKSGEIVFDFVNADYKVRLPADDLLAAAKAAAD
jgi:peroxiredoxin